MDEMKKSLRKDGRVLGLTLISHQVLFQTISAVLMVILFIALEAAELARFEGAGVYIASDLAMLVTSVVFLVFYLANRTRLWGNSPEKSKFSLASLGVCLIIILSANCFFSSIETLFNYATGLSLTMSAAEEMTVDPLLLIAVIGVFPAVVEELIFRGVIYRYLRKHGCVFAAISSSLIFGLIHLNVLQFLFASCMGLVLCYVYERSGKLIHAMLLHFINNSLMVVLTVLPINGTALKTGECVIGIAAFAAAIIFAAKKKPLRSIDSADVRRKCRCFFTSIPMALLALVCLAVCVAVIFIKEL